MKNKIIKKIESIIDKNRTEMEKFKKSYGTGYNFMQFYKIKETIVNELNKILEELKNEK